MSDYQNPFSDQKHYHEHSEWISEHIAKFYPDSVVSVFHEIPTLDIHMDVYLIKPQDKAFHILLTSGMSTLEMKVSEHAENPEELAFAELMILIPESIAFASVFTGKNENDWIISMLKRTAKFPHFYDTWIGIGHTIQAEEDGSAYGPDTSFVGAIVLPSVTFAEDFTTINKNGRKINIYSLFPLYTNELAFKVENGFSKFLDLIINANAEEVLDLERKNLIPSNFF